MPNYNGYQPDAEGKLVFNPDSYLDADKPFVTYPAGYVATTARAACTTRTGICRSSRPPARTAAPTGRTIRSATSTNLVYFPYGANPVAHWRGAGGNGQRAIGQYQTGGILALDASTGEVAWTNHLGIDMSHGQGPLTTASDLLFVGQIDGNFLALDAATGKELWRFQTGSGIAAAPITYEIDGEQYVAIFAAGIDEPVRQLGHAGRLAVGVQARRHLHDGVGQQRGPDTAPLTIRRPGRVAPVEGSDGEQHGLPRAGEPDRRHGRRTRQRAANAHVADAHARAGGHDGDVPATRGRRRSRTSRT